MYQKTYLNYKCDYCKKLISVPKWKLKAHKHHFCSLQCRYDWQKENFKGKNNIFFGKKHSEETKQLLSLKLKGKPAWNKGKKTTKQQRLKMSEARKKYYKEHPEALKKIRQRNIGRKQSAETIEKRVSKIRGKKRPRWVVEKIKKNLPRGKKHWWWRGGVSTIKHRLRNHSKYKNWRRAVFERDNYTCQVCGKNGGKLAPHHIVGFSLILQKLRKRYGIKDLYERALRSKLLWNINNGITLCEECHKKTDNFAKNNYN